MSAVAVQPMRASFRFVESFMMEWSFEIGMTRNRKGVAARPLTTGDDDARLDRRHTAAHTCDVAAKSRAMSSPDADRTPIPTGDEFVWERERPRATFGQVRRTK
jgi:hypothetical protein